MFDLSPNADSADADLTIRPAIYLDYGVDGAGAEDLSCEVCERGMRFRSRWQFEPGAAMSVAFRLGQDACRRVEVEGAVVECVQTKDREYLTTLVFLEAPGELRAALGELSHRLGAAQVQNGHARDFRPTRPTA